MKRATFLVVFLALLFAPALRVSALTVHLTAADLARFLAQLANADDPRARTMAADLKDRLAAAGISFNESGFLASGEIPRKKIDTDCKLVPILKGLTVRRGSWTARLEGDKTWFGFGLTPGRVAFDAQVKGRASGETSGTIDYGVGDGLGLTCIGAGHESFDVELDAKFRVTLGVSLDATIEQDAEGHWEIVLGRQTLANHADAITGSARVNLDTDVSSSSGITGRILEVLLDKGVAPPLESGLRDRFRDLVADKNDQLRAKLPIHYRLPGPEDPQVRKLLERVVDIPVLGRFLEANFHRVVFYLLTEDKEALRRLLVSGPACDAVFSLRNRRALLPVLYTRNSGTCVAANPDGVDVPPYFSDAACTSEVAFRPTAHVEFCNEILVMKPNAGLGNAATWTRDASQPNDPAPNVPSRKWTLAHGASMALSSESIDAKTVPFMKRVRYRTVTTSYPRLRPLYWGCVEYSMGSPCNRYAAYTSPLPTPPWGPAGTLLGYLHAEPVPGTTPLYWACKSFNMYGNGCTSYELSTSPGSAPMLASQSVLLGYAKTAPVTKGSVTNQASVPVYWGCAGGQACQSPSNWTVRTEPAGPGHAPVAYVTDPAIVERGSCSLEMRIYKKNVSQTGLMPLLAFHGGSWQYRGGGFLGLEAQIAHYTDQGFVVFAPFYRLAGTKDGNTACNGAPWEAIVSDAEAALDWVKTYGTAFGAKSPRPAVMGQSAGAHLAGWLTSHRPEDVAAGVLLYPPSDFADLITETVPVTGAYHAGFSGNIGILSTFLDTDVRQLDLSRLPEAVTQNSFHALAGGAPPVFLLHGMADSLVPANQSVLWCNAYGGNAENDGGGAQRRATYTCGPRGGQLHLFEQAEHALDGCVTSPFLNECAAGDAQSRSLVADSMRQARLWLANRVNVPPTASAGSDQVVNAGATVTLAGACADSDGILATCRWSQVSGPSVTLAAAHNPATTFVAPAVTADAIVTLRLTATDNNDGTGSSTVRITVKAPVPIPNLASLHWVCPYMSQACQSPSGFRLEVNSIQGGTLGYLKTQPEPGTVPLYWACTAFAMSQTGCGGYAPRTSVVAGPYGPLPATLLGYVRTSADGTLTTPLYWSCTPGMYGPSSCTAVVATPQTPVGPTSTLLGHIYKRTTRPGL